MAGSIADVFYELLVRRSSVVGIALAFLGLLLELVPRLEVVGVDAAGLCLEAAVLLSVVSRRRLPGLLG